MWDEDNEEDSGETHDKKLEQMWSKKQRRRSSGLKILQGDKLKLQENPKLAVLLTKNGEN